MPYDVLILGGGPGGLSTALHLLQRSTRDFMPAILILERESRYRFVAAQEVEAAFRKNDFSFNILLVAWIFVINWSKRLT